MSPKKAAKPKLKPQSRPDVAVQREIADLVTRHGPSEIAKRAGVSARVVEYWASGERKPTTANLARLRASFPARQELPYVGAITQPPAPRDSKTIAQATVDRLERVLAQLEGDAGATSREKAAVATSLTSATRLLARLAGSLDVSESQIVRSAPWKRLVEVLRAALHPFPDALRAATEAVERYESEGR